MNLLDLRAVAIDLFLQTQKKVSIAEVMRKRIARVDSTLRVGDVAYHLQDFDRIVIVAIGKAAVPMFEALAPLVEPEPASRQTLRQTSRQTLRQTIEGIIVGTALPSRKDPRFQHLLGSHPIPDEGSRVAADAILKLLQSCGQGCLVLFLLSGGASAMVEKPLDANITLSQAALFHRSLVHSGLPITQMNVLRKHISQVKGGRLAVAATGATQCTLLISDVPGTLDMVGSGPSLPDPSTIEECRRLIDSNLAALNLPGELLAFFRDPALPETPKPADPAFIKAQWISLLSSDDLCREASALASGLGFKVVVDNGCDDWDYREAAAYLLDAVTALHRENPRICLLSAGEVSVKLGDRHGLGGRNQQFVLECARLIAERSPGMPGLPGITVLSAGSDGIDGNSPSAGAVCDETTFARAREHGLEPLACLAQFDSYRLFNALGDAILTGPTGNNIRDLRMLLMST